MPFDTPPVASSTVAAPASQRRLDGSAPVPHPLRLEQGYGHWLWFWLPLAVVTAVLVTVSGDLGWAAVGGAELTGGKLVGSTASRQLAFLTLGGLGLLLWYAGPRQAKQPVWQLLLPAGLLLAYVFATTLWSDDPSTTLKRTIVMTCIVIAGLGLGRSWDYRQFNLAIMAISLCFLCLSLVAEMRYRAFLTNPADYRFSGIVHPAKQAFNCGMLALASLSLFLNDRRKAYLCVTAVALGLLMLTKARTGLAATLVAGGVLVWPHRSLKIMVFGSLAAAWLLGAAMIFAGATGSHIRVDRLATMGRDEELADPTKLTGRLPIWNQALERFSQRPLLGYGYGAFWTAQRLEDFERSNGWALAHCHSAYIEALVNLGVVGAIAGWLVVAIAFVRSIRISARKSAAAARLVAALLTMAVISGLTEMAFIGDGYEFFAVVSGIGLLAFQPVVVRRPAERSFGRPKVAATDLPPSRGVSLLGTPR